MPDSASSSLSSPPESVIKVDLGLPKEATESSFLAAEPAEVREGTLELDRDADGDGEPERNPVTPAVEDDDQPIVHKRKTRTSRKPARAKKPRLTFAASGSSSQNKKWEAPFVYTDPRSPLAKVDLRAMLLHPGAWDMLTEEGKRDVLAKFPGGTDILGAGTPNASPNLESLRSENNFRRDCARYSENIELGRHDEEWLRQAWIAHERYKRGDFDEYLRLKFEDVWNTKLPDDNPPKAPSSSGTGDFNPAAAKLEVSGHSQRLDSAAAEEGLPGPTASPLTPSSLQPAGDPSPQNVPGTSRTKAAPVEQIQQYQEPVNSSEPGETGTSIGDAAKEDERSDATRVLRVTKAD